MIFKMKPKNIISVLIMVLILFSIGCRRSPDNPNRFAKQVNVSELIGAWQITDSALKELKEEGYRNYISKDDHYLILRSDMTCEICAFSYIINFPTIQDESKSYIFKKEGTWKLKKTEMPFAGETKDVFAVEILLENKIENDKAIYIYGTYIDFYVAEINDKIILWNYVGDPDYKQYYDFVKENG